jgi:hypothetical protein
MDLNRADYVVRYYSAFMTSQEHLAQRHLLATFKITHGRTDDFAQGEASESSKPIRDLVSTDPEVKRLAAGGWDAFALRTAERIYREHRDEICFNECPRCGKLAKTPKSKQCRYCHHDWHEPNG